MSLMESAISQSQQPAISFMTVEEEQESTSAFGSGGGGGELSLSDSLVSNITLGGVIAVAVLLSAMLICLFAMVLSITLDCWWSLGDLLDSCGLGGGEDGGEVMVGGSGGGGDHTCKDTTRLVDQQRRRPMPRLATTNLHHRRSWGVGKFGSGGLLRNWGWRRGSGRGDNEIPTFDYWSAPYSRGGAKGQMDIYGMPGLEGRNALVENEDDDEETIFAFGNPAYCDYQNHHHNRQLEGRLGCETWRAGEKELLGGGRELHERTAMRRGRPPPPPPQLSWLRLARSGTGVRSVRASCAYDVLREEEELL